MDDTYLAALLVDDDQDDYIITRDLLEDTGTIYHLDWVSSFHAALHEMNTKPYAVCLVDYRLGEYNGIELVLAAIKQGCNAPIIMLTGQGDDAVGLDALKAGASDYLIKNKMDAHLLERAIRYAIERKRAEDARIQLIREQSARAEAEAAVFARDRFLSIAAHELKTPLTALLGSIQLFERRITREHKLEERQLRSLNVITGQALRLNRMIEALFDASRIEAGQFQIEQGVIDLDQLLRRIVEDFQASLERHILVIEPSPEPLPVLGDEIRLEQVFQNLIQNSIKYSPAGDTIEVRIAREGPNATVAVSDHGIGIPQSALPHLFERFYRAENASEQRIHGMGIGLFVVREIVRQHNGMINVESEQGKGSTFTVTLPLAEVPAPVA